MGERERERRRIPSSIRASILCDEHLEFRGETEESGRKYTIIQNQGADKENASQPTEFNDEFLREQNSVIFPAGNTRSLPFRILVQLARHARFHKKRKKREREVEEEKENYVVLSW